MSHRQSSAIRSSLALRLCLATYPAGFRRTYSSAIEQTFRDRVNAARRRGLVAWSTTGLAELGNIASQGLLMRLNRTSSSATEGPAPDGHTGRTPRRILDPLRQDLKLARRTLKRRPGAAVATVLLLGVGIGLNTVMFGLTDAYLLNALPYPESERLVSIRPIPPGAPPELQATMPDRIDEIEWPVRDQVIEDLVTWDLDAFTLMGGDQPEVTQGAWVPPGYLRALRTTPLLGRLFTDEDGRPGAQPVVILGYNLWQQRFGGDAEVIGRTISGYAADRPFESESFTVVGVLPEDFWFTNSYTEILANLTEPRSPYMLRLQPGVTAEQAATHLTGIVRAQIDDVDANWPGMHVESTHELHVERVRPVLTILAAAAGLVLLISCGNVALLLTVRAFGRQREIGVRQALGASRWRVGQQLAAEGFIMAGLACILGVGSAWLLLRSLGPALQEQLRTTIPGGVEHLGINIPALLLAVGLSAITGIIFTVFPAMVTTRADLATSVREGNRTGSDTPGRQHIRNGIIALEVAISLMLSVGAALMLRSALNLHRIDLGFRHENVLTAGINLRQRSYPEDHQLTAFVTQYLEAVRATPGVASASLLAGWPFQDRIRTEVETDGGVTSAQSPVIYVVTDGYFETMSIPVRNGRGIEVRDRTESEPVIVIGESLANSLWYGENPVGRRVRLGAEGEDAPWRTIVGVADDVRETLTGETVPDTYIPHSQAASPFLFLIARASSDPASIVPAAQRALSSVDPTAAMTRIVPMTDLVAGQLTRPQFLAALLVVFGGLAMLLALTGLYSIVTYAVSQRRRDIAIHMALGAHDRAVITMFMRKATMVVVGGVAVGLAASLALTRTLSSQLYGVSSIDAAAFLGSALLMLTAAIAASWIPARRAATTDPIEVLRED